MINTEGMEVRRSKGIPPGQVMIVHRRGLPSVIIGSKNESFSTITGQRPQLWTSRMLGVREAERDRRKHPRTRYVISFDEDMLAPVSNVDLDYTLFSLARDPLLQSIERERIERRAYFQNELRQMLPMQDIMTLFPQIIDPL